MNFEQALKDGDLDVARAILDELAELPETGGLEMSDCYADLAREFDRQGRHDDAIALHERAIEHGWNSIPDARSDIAEFHLRDGREAEAAAIWAELKAEDPDDVWLYNAAGLSYNEARARDPVAGRRDRACDAHRRPGGDHQPALRRPPPEPERPGSRPRRA